MSYLIVSTKRTNHFIGTTPSMCPTVRSKAGDFMRASRPLGLNLESLAETVKYLRANSKPFCKHCQKIAAKVQAELDAATPKAYALPIGALSGDLSQAELDFLSMEAFGTTDPSEILDALLAESAAMFLAPTMDSLPLDPWA